MTTPVKIFELLNELKKKVDVELQKLPFKVVFNFEFKKEFNDAYYAVVRFGEKSGNFPNQLLLAKSRLLSEKSWKSLNRWFKCTNVQNKET